MAKNISGGLVHELPSDLLVELTKTKEITNLREGTKRPCCWAGCFHRKDKKPGKWQQVVLPGKNSIEPGQKYSVATHSRRGVLTVGHPGVALNFRPVPATCAICL